MADIAIPVANLFLEYLIEPVGRQFGYLLFYKRYLKELEEGVGKLKGEKDGVENKCKAARCNVMVIEKKVENWLDDVNEAVKNADIILGDDDVQSWNRCFCLNPPVFRSQEGRKAKKTKQTIEDLNKARKNLGNIAFEAPIHPELSAKDYEAFASRSKIVEDIMEALSDASISAIGVWGMGGVGKSTLMKEVMRVAKEKNLFDDVAIATVSQNPDIKTIQGDIGLWLGLKLESDQSVRERAARLHKRLKNKKSTAEQLENKIKSAAGHEKQDDDHQVQEVEEKIMDKKSSKVLESGKQKQVLIILDDLWRRLDLEEVGIPQDAGGPVKLLLTSRNQHVLSSEMGCYRNVFKLEVLKGNEPWRLFEGIVVGEKKQLDDTLRKIGEEVVEKCSGLPHVLRAIATTLKNCSLPEWEDALARVRGSKDAYSSLEISYWHLESEELKSLFLVCALWGRARLLVQYLSYYSMGLGLLRGGTNTVRNARDKLKALLHSLQAYSLLLEDDDPNYVKIHDVVHEVAIRIASRDQYSFLITHGYELMEIPREKLKKSRAVSIPYVKNFQKLPEGWECPELKMFLLFRRKDDSPIGISDSFFRGMKELKVLDFSGLCSDSLPSSIQFLQNLNTLCLDYCSLKDLTIIGKLKQLHILTFLGSEIARLPQEIGELSELKVLNLRDSKLDTIEPQILGKLTSLEELDMEGCSFMGWEDEIQIQPSNAKVSELNNMLNLSSVNIHIGDSTRIPKQLEFGNLVEYKIQIGDVWDWSGDYKESRNLKIKLEPSRSNMLREKWVQDLLKRTQDLHLDGLMGRTTKSINELCLQDGFQELKHLYVRNSASIQCVTHSPRLFPRTAFTLLESLVLENLTELEIISRGPLTADSLSKLKVIKVTNCGKLKSLFCYSMLKGLSQLEEIEVSDCEMMQEIVDNSVATNDEAVSLQALRRIKLHSLPNFMRFCSSSQVLEVNQTEEIISEDQHCIPTNTLFFSKQLVSYPLALETLIVSSLPKLKNLWKNDCVVEVAKLKYLEVTSCKDLLTVIPSSLVSRLGNLESLIVTDCGSVQEIFECHHSNVEILPRLNTLRLSDLPCMRHIWPRHYCLQLRVFQNLKLLDVNNCNSLLNLFPAAILKSLRQVAEMTIKNCENMEQVFISETEGDGGEGEITAIDDDPTIIVHSLVEVWLENLPNMVTFVRVDESINFPSLEDLYVQKCPKMRAFSLPKGGDASLELYFFDRKVLLPNLVRLDLISVGSMEKIWHDEAFGQSFCKLEILVVKDCQNLVNIFPSTVIGTRGLQFQNLKEIIVRECASLKGSLFEFVWEGEEKGKGYKKGYSLPQLEKLWLFGLPKLEHVLEPTSHVVLGFPNLVEISIADCGSVIGVLPIASTPTLSKLEKLHILRCSSMRQVFGKQEEYEEEDEMMMSSILFPCLRSIIVLSLDSLICLFFLGTSCVLDFPSLEYLHISRCPSLKTFVQRHITCDKLEELSPSYINEGVHYLFDDKVLLPNFVRLELISAGTMKKVWHEEISEESFCKLEKLIVKDCQNLVNIFPSTVIGTRGLQFQNLKEIIVRECASLKGSLFEFVWEGEEKGKGYKKGYSLPQLEKLWLFGLPKLEHVLEPTSHVVLGFPNLVEISIADCNSLLNLFPAAILKSLPQVTEMTIKNCESMEQVFISETEGDGGEGEITAIDDDPTIIFHSLVEVWLENLPNMVTFVRVDKSINFPSLKELYVKKCPKMRAFSLPKGGDASLELYFFDRKVLLPELMTLYLISAGSMEKIWHDEAFGQSFCQLEMLFVRDCRNLVNIFPSTVIGTRGFQFQNLKEIKVIECASLKGSLFEFVWEGEEKEKGYSLPQLEELWLHDLPKLEHVLEPTSHVVLGFPNLVDISIADCRSVIGVLPIASTPTLSKLEKLQILRCSSMRQVFGKQEEYEEEDEMMGSILFPRLRSIIVEKLDSLICFFFLGTSCVLDFPSLEVLKIFWCPSLKTFVQRHTTSDKSEELSPSYINEGVHYLFDDKVLLPNLVRLELISAGSMKKVWHEEISEESFCKLEILVNDCQNLVNIFPSTVIGTRGLQFQNLKQIIVRECASLKGSLFEFVWKGEEKEKGYSLPIFQSLVDVWLENLPNMVTFVRVDKSINFPSLKKLYVKKCPKMRAFSLPKGGDASLELYFFDRKVLLPNLVRLDLISVGSMEKIWHDEVFEQSFCQLEILVVRDCQNLVNIFPSTVIGTRGLQFQNLKEIIVCECASLKGSLFEFVWEGEEKGKGYKKGYSLPQLEKLWLFGLSKLEHVLEPTSHVVLGFPNLVEISIADCGSVIGVLPIASTPTLSKLEKLHILRCSSMRQVFGKQEEYEEEDEMMMSSILFPCLRSIIVLSLDSLICLFFLGTSCVLDFPSLEVLKIFWCPSLKTFVQRHTTSDKSEELSPSYINEGVHYLFDDKVQFPNLQKMELFQLSSLRTIWKSRELLVPAASCRFDSFSRLKSLIVADCKDLLHIFPASLASNLVRLEELNINSCGVEEIVMHDIDDDNDGSREDGTSNPFFFPQLMTLVWYDLPNLRSFFRGSNASTWPVLNTFRMGHCDKVHIFTSNCENSCCSRQCLFSAEQVIPMLENLTLVEEDAIMIQNGEFRDDIFSGLKQFFLACFHDERAAFPSRFLLDDKFQKLEKLTVLCSSFEEIFPDESLSPQDIISYKQRFAFAAGDQGNEIVRPFARLRELRLSKLSKLKHVWKEDMTILAKILRSIQVLEIVNCSSLKSIFPTASAASFGNITKLEVRECHGLLELMSTSAATSLVKLNQMDIYDCGMIQEIVSAGGYDGGSSNSSAKDGEELVISFRELKHLGFHRLRSLTSFSSSTNCTFEFPSLEELIVIQCPSLKIFSKSNVVAPKLSQVQEEKDKVRWDGDLNTTIQNLFEEEEL